MGGQRGSPQDPLGVRVPLGSPRPAELPLGRWYKSSADEDEVPTSY